MKDRGQDDWDDGRVIAPMNGDELPRYRRIFAGKRMERRVKTDVTKKEQWAMIRAMFAVMLPRLVVILLGFALVFGLIGLWLA